MSELTALRQLLQAAPLNTSTAAQLEQRIAQLAPSSPVVGQQQTVTRQRALAIEQQSRRAVEADEVEAYQLTEQQAALLADYRNQQELAGSQPVSAPQGLGQATEREQTFNYERLVELGLV